MKLLKSSLVALVAVLMITTSKPSQAAVGAISGNPALVISGLQVTGGGAVLFGLGMAAGRADNSMMGMSGLLPGLFGFALGLVGLVMMDEDQSLSFDQLSESEAQKLGLTSAELELYNAEIDQVNALASHVDNELSQVAKPSLKDSAAVWATVQDAISPGTFSAMQKITSQLN